MRSFVLLRWYWRWIIVAVAAALATVGVILGVRVVLSPRVTVDGEPLTWVDWTGVVGVPLAVVGVAAAVVQLLRVQTTAEAARDAVDRALTALGRSELLVEFQTMRQLEYDPAMSPGADRDAVNRFIREVREVSGRIATTLSQNDASDPLVANMEAVRGAASEVRLVIMGGRANLNLWNVTRKLREELVPTCDRIATRMNEMRLDVRAEGSEDVS